MRTLLIATHVLLMLAMPILMVGLVNRTKSWWGGRRGPRLAQSAWDLLRLLRKRWTFTRWGRRTDAEIFAAPQLPGFAVAVRVADAARIWGWGAATDQAPAPVELNTYADVVKHHRANQGALWDVPPGQYDLLRAEEKRANDAGEMGVRARMAQDFGVSVRRIGQLLAKIESGSRATQRTRAQKVQPLPGLKAV